MRLRNVLFSILCGACMTLSAHGVDSLSSEVLADGVGMMYVPERSIYEIRKANRERQWQRLIPTHLKLQYAGSIGFMSLGVGWSYGKSNQWETDLMFGFVPKYDSDKNKLVFTVKQSYIPWIVRFGDSDFNFKPLACGVFFSSVLTGDFWISEPDRYPGGYYNFSTRFRANIFLGQRITYFHPREKRTYIQGCSLYYEFSACDADLVTFFGDKCIKIEDILSLALGLKVHL
ncbi:MAG: hypothetical protein II222_06485 [Paraprevotella sp.]|nr:hypothetical protein [Paraprevotella sp.]